MRWGGVKIWFHNQLKKCSLGDFTRDHWELWPSADCHHMEAANHAKTDLTKSGGLWKHSDHTPGCIYANDQWCNEGFFYSCDVWVSVFCFMTPWILLGQFSAAKSCVVLMDLCCWIRLLSEQPWGVQPVLHTGGVAVWCCEHFTAFAKALLWGNIKIGYCAVRATNERI